MQNLVKTARQHITNWQEERRRTIALDAELEAALIDPGLIDRILGDRSVGPEIPKEVFTPEPVRRPMRSLDGILRAV